MWLCDWKDFDRECARLLAALRAGESALEPTTLLAISASQADQLKCGSLYAAENFAARSPSFENPGARRDRLRVAYVSPDFRDHPVSFLTAGMLEEHDKSRFDILAIALSSDGTSAMRTRIRRAVSEFIEADGRSDAELVALLRESRIDIAVDLAGYTLGGRPSAFAQRVAPVQVTARPGRSESGFPKRPGGASLRH